jgi:recombination protein RecT
MNDLKKKIAASTGNKQLTLKERLNQWVDGNPKELVRYLDSPKEAARLVQSFLDAAAKVPKLYECDHKTITSCLMMSAQTRLYTGAMGECAYVPFFNSKRGVHEAVFMPMYAGLVKLAYNSGFVKSLSIDVVYDDDVFEYEKGTKEFLRHVPNLEPEGKRKMICAYCVVELRTGGTQITVLPMKFIYSVRDRSKAAKKKDSPWQNPDDFPQMCKKTAIKQALKYIPKSAELAVSLDLDDAAESDRDDSVAMEQNHAEESEAIDAIFEPVAEPEAEKAEPVIDTSAAPFEEMPPVVDEQGNNVV